MSRKDKTTFAIWEVIGLVQMALVGLRLGTVIDWHWAWVLSPTLFCAGLFSLIVIVATGIAVFEDWH